MDPKTSNVLFLCTGNSARSILAETLLNNLGNGRFKAYSAGSHPNGKVHPLAIKWLSEQGYATDQLRSKSWDEFAALNAPPMDFILTVCDNAAGEACPIWPGHPTTAHWGVPDPGVTGSDAEKWDAFCDVASTLKHRVELLVKMPSNVAKTEAQSRLREIGKE